MNATDVEPRPSVNPLKTPTIIGMLLLAAMIILPIFIDVHHHDEGGEHADTTTSIIDAASPDSVELTEPANSVPDFWLIGTIPFICLLLAIAILPLIPFTHHWWENNMNRLAMAIGLGWLTLFYYMFTEGFHGAVLAVEHAIPGEYIPFIMLLFSLYVISGGISITGDLRATPMVNTTFLLVGTLIASFIGTTGASMLLIRPLLETNRERKHVVHTVIFFIFLVSNIGGSLLPIGDPPLFLGYLRGVPFEWTLSLWPQWLMASLILLVVYFIWDKIAFSRELPADIIHDKFERRPLRMRGNLNLLLLLGVILAVAFLDPSKAIPGTEWKPFMFMRELVMLGLTGLSLLITKKEIRETNRFNYHAIAEVAALFVGIFVTMQVPLAVLKAYGAELPIETPTHFFWITGMLSSFLDNAPTYLVFFETADAMTSVDGPGVLTLTDGSFINENLLIGISLGAVFMGANTYIGNGPNFMVKSIAEQSGIRMPSFFGYFFLAMIILLPVFILVNLVLIPS